MLDPTSNIGKVRLRVGDYQDPPMQFFPDSVYTSALEDNNQNIARASKAVACFILAQMCQQGNIVLGPLSLYDADMAKSYQVYLNMIIKDSSFSGFAPIPYFGGADTPNPVVEWNNTWKCNNNLQYLEEAVKDVSCESVVL